MALGLVDLGLPDGSGIDLIAEWRAADPALPILVIRPGARKTPSWPRCAPGPPATC